MGESDDRLGDAPGGSRFDSDVLSGEVVAMIGESPFVESVQRDSASHVALRYSVRLNTGSMIDIVSPMLHTDSLGNHQGGWKLELFLSGIASDQPDAVTISDSPSAESLSQAMSALARLGLADKWRREGA